ncbi:CYTH domain-containing protein [Clostridium beijerinckii]|uniref:CYTH domain-containing protein n=1 Tax=Clostridium TaxID=1485 RepID=UPI000B40168C|nr:MULTISPECIES: CYTH domain-containing protein [Clostridium]NOW07505.1 uncharacterized protein YjbK [Clostridium beijerinckii]NYC04722.1 uncharacterized protein YjbK [Clostridium beijerinckii]OVE67259.1 hypothetical protein CCS79_14115 [Clostridium diolis]UYZ35675.1 CYTH domain-containing protein [Clostridium beijerinckii]
MEHSKEIELKLLLNRDGYDSIEKRFINDKLSIIQENFYFDTNTHILRNNKITLRIRKEVHDFNICFKVKNHEEEQSIRKSSEYTLNINENEFLSIINNPESIKKFFSKEAMEILNALNINQESIVMFGNIRNKRTYIKGLLGYTFELDMSSFPNNIVEYELEIENIKSEDREKLLNELENLGVEFSINKKSKYERFVEILEHKK